jgi:hypothetical protein
VSSGWPATTGWPVAFTTRRSTHPSTLGEMACTRVSSKVTWPTVRTSFASAPICAVAYVTPMRCASVAESVTGCPAADAAAPPWTWPAGAGVAPPSPRVAR